MTVKTNYSNPPFISKMIEKCTLNQLTTQQHAQPPPRISISKQSLLILVNDTLWAMEQQQITAVLILDLLSAFDRVNHDFLLDVLQRTFSITSTVLKWYKNFLKLRKFKVCINGSYSPKWIMDFGLPQGSTQGAYLFNCYVSTLSETVKTH